MTASSSQTGGPGDLDQLILRAFDALRAARRAYLAAGTAANAGSRERAEENLNALLDFRYATVRRAAPPDPAVPGGGGGRVAV